MTEQKHVHFIGMCGTAMAPVAKMFFDLGWKVTGSDRGIYPPMSDYLSENKIPLTVGWHPELIGSPDLVVVGYAVTLSNPELLYVKENGLRAISYPEALGEYLVKKESIVVVGTAGKTSISGLLAWIFETAERNPSFMSAGYQKNFTDGVRNTDSNWSIMEGDEPFASQDIRKSKFFFYKPKYVILTGAEWDHKDMFPTPESYIENFVELLKVLPSDGLIVANRDGENVEEVIERYYNHSRSRNLVVGEKNTEARVVWYGGDIQQSTDNSQQNNNVIARLPKQSSNISHGSEAVNNGRSRHSVRDDNCYFYSDIKILDEGKVRFKVVLRQASADADALADKQDDKVLGEFTLNLIGKFNVENATAAIAMALETRVSVEDVKRGVETFLGIKRRMDIRYDDGKRKVIDDFAHNTMKFKNAIEALRMHYPKEKLVVVAEPNIGSRTKDSLPLFKGIFKGIDLLIMPEFSVTTLPDVISSHDVYEVIKDDVNAVVIPNDEELVSRAVEEIKDGGIVSFMGSHGFRGMIEMAVESLKVHKV